MYCMTDKPKDTPSDLVGTTHIPLEVEANFIYGAPRSANKLTAESAVIEVGDLPAQCIEPWTDLGNKAG